MCGLARILGKSPTLFMRVSGAVAFGFVISPPRKYASLLRGTTVMSKRTREKKSAKPQQPAKPDQIPVGRKFAQPYAKARLLLGLHKASCDKTQ
jgi:hypothetical protein